MARKRPDLEKRRVQIGTVPIYYEVTGQGDPLILVHGLSGSTRWWAKNIQPLSEHFRVHVVDLVGFGSSRSRHPFALEEAADFLVKWMDAIGIESADLIGHSMGGFIAADLAADYPERIKRLVLVDAAGLPFEPNVIIHARDVVRAVRYVPWDFFPVVLWDLLRAGPLTMTRAILQILTSSLEHKLTNIDLQTLVVWGEFDTVISVEVGQKLSQALSHAKFVVLKGAGHNAMWDRPNAFNEAVLNFLLNPSPADASEETAPQAIQLV